jgi:hypothetical protein
MMEILSTSDDLPECLSQIDIAGGGNYSRFTLT